MRANKLSRTYAVLVDALNRYRGKEGQQKVTVEHVDVHAGGQAVVGLVESPRHESDTAMPKRGRQDRRFSDDIVVRSNGKRNASRAENRGRLRHEGGLKRPYTVCNLTDVRNPFLGFYFRRANRLCRKLKHRCFLTFN